MNYQRVSGGHAHHVQRVLKRMNSTGDINNGSSSQHLPNEEVITGDVIKDIYPGEEMQTDDDELV